MGIFSGGFGTGLATGLATSVNKSLTDAMDRREEELSKARVFWQTRQAQKQDQVDAENKRIEKAYKRVTNEMGGDAAKGLAAYQAIGGTVDDVERYIAVLNKTQESNMEYSLQDRLDFDGLSLGDYGDFTFDKGFDSIKSVVTAADVNYVEAPSILTAIGLGQDTDRVGKSLQQQVDQLIPRSERTDAGIGAAKIKGSLYAGTISEEEARRLALSENFEKKSIRLDSELQELEPGTPEHIAKMKEITRHNKTVSDFYSYKNPLKPSTPSASTYRIGLSDSLENVIKNNTSATGALLDAEGQPIYDDEKIKARTKELEDEAYTPYMDNIFNPDGTYVNQNAQEMIELSGNPRLQSIAAREQARRRGEAPSGGGPPLTEEQIANAASLKVRDAVDTTDKLPEAIIKGGNITPEDEAKVIENLVAKGGAGLNEEQLADYEEKVKSVYGRLFNEAREAKEREERKATPAGRLEVLQDTITNFALSDEASTETIEAIKEANDKLYLTYAGMGAGIPAKERDRMEADVIEDKAEENLKQILKDGGYDPILVKQNSKAAYDELLGNLATKYKQAVENQRTTAQKAKEEKQRLNTLRLRN